VTTSGTTTCPSILPFASSRVGTSQDDFGLLKRQKRPHLSEVFIGRKKEIKKKRINYRYFRPVMARQAVNFWCWTVPSICICNLSPFGKRRSFRCQQFGHFWGIPGEH
jgi:hypothetical protein